VIAVHTLGPTGTNCERAARFWLDRRPASAGTVHLHESLEAAARSVVTDQRPGALLACVVYPALHELVYHNLGRLTLRDCFVMPTHHMVLAAPSGAGDIHTVASHPAPVSLAEEIGAGIVLVESNSVAAATCRQGLADACITTSVAASQHQLEVIKDFGAIEMAFTIHVPLGVDV
jgi:prephenate dehydratase